MDSQKPTSELIIQAKAAYEAEEYRAAAELFETAAQRYQDEGNPVDAAEMQNNRSVALLQAGDAQAALQVVLGTDEVFATAGDLRRQAMALGNQASAQEALKNYDAAYDLYSRSSDLLKQAGEKDLRSYVLQRMSNLQLRRGDRYEAVATMQTALDSRQKLGLKERVLKGLLNKVNQLMGQK